ncbi:MAG: PAS domain-containing sensor histidine kinase [Gemmatimonadaceae bacterium]
MADRTTDPSSQSSIPAAERVSSRTSEHAVHDAAPFARSKLDGARVSEGDGLFRLLVESVMDYAIFALDPGGHVVSWNLGAQRFKGYLPDEIIGKHFSVFYGEDEKDTKPAMELETAAREGRAEDEGWRLRKDGTRFWANVVITALRDGNGHLVGFAKVTRDLSERRAAELQALAAARRVSQAEEANQVKASFLAAMSHELRTPLNAIGGYADLLLTGIGGDVSARQRQYLERIRNSQQHLLAIINDILNFSRIEAGRLQLEIGPVSLQAVVDAVVPMIEPQAAAKNLVVEQGSFDKALVSGDHAKIEQILVNLLSNAVKFTEPGGRISIDCEENGDCVELSVRDTGIGIPDTDIDAIFQPFIQVGRSLTSKQEGTGLGLAISSDLATAMGGALRVESVIGEGSTFTLSLPKVNATDP